MPRWQLVKQDPADLTFHDTGQSCDATSWPAAVWQLLWDDLLDKAHMLDLIDKVHCGSLTQIRAGSGLYRVVELDDGLADLDLDIARVMSEGEEG